MTTRKKLLAYHLATAAGFIGTLAASSPDLLPPVVGFAAVYIPAYAVISFLGWLIWRDRRISVWVRIAACAFWSAQALIWFTAAGGPGAGLAGMVCALVSFSPWWSFGKRREVAA